MSRFVINNLVYDTDKMEHLGAVKKWRKNEIISMMMHEERGGYKTHNLYRSKKGNYLITYEDCGYIYAEAIKEDEAKDLLMRYDYDNYRIVFGELEVVLND